MRGLKAFFAGECAQMKARSLEALGVIALSWFATFLTSGYLFCFACWVRSGSAALCFGFVTLICGIRMVIAMKAFEAKLAKPYRFEHVGEHRKAVGREFQI